ncbi:hypothetical protein 015DV004_237 [Bacillus phage 015DV004]|nr:hypothetical protein 015DV004_237 [Bacillus phage 015DV004]
MSRVRQLYDNTLQELADAKRVNDVEEIIFLQGRVSAFEDVLAVNDMEIREGRYWSKEDKDSFVVKALQKEANILITYLHNPHTYAYYDLGGMKKTCQRLKSIKSALEKYNHTAEELSEEIEDLDRKIKKRVQDKEDKQ